MCTKLPSSDLHLGSLREASLESNRLFESNYIYFKLNQRINLSHFQEAPQTQKHLNKHKHINNPSNTKQLT